MQNDYTVGYGKPPRNRQFKPGRSGNPAGRRRGTKNLKTDLMEELAEFITVREGDKITRISKQRAIIKSMVAGAAKGDSRQLIALVNLILRFFGMDDSNEHEKLTKEEQAIIVRLVERVTGQDSAGPETTKSA